MKKFLYSTLMFIGIIIIISIMIILSPTTPPAAEYMLFTSIKKDSLMKHVQQPRIVLIGGSNIPYGIDSRLIHDSLQVNIVDAGLHAGLGLKYMLDDANNYIKPGDIALIIPEYEHFYGNFAYGAEALLRLILDVQYSNIKYIDHKQIACIAKFIPQYIKSKIQIKSYTKTIMPDVVFSNIAFDEYGDAYLHRDRKKRENTDITKIEEEGINTQFYDYFVSSINQMKQRGIEVYISFPAIQAMAFKIDKENINRVYQKHKDSRLQILGKPQDYIIPDSLIYDSKYHLRNQGIFMRTEQLIKEIKAQKILNKK